MTTQVNSKKSEKTFHFSLKRNKKTDDYFSDRSLRRGSDPRLQTCRGKLQSRRSKLNMEINRELMLRSGAENLYNATSNKKLKEMVALELHFFNNNLHLLKDQLGELNSSVEVYQGSSAKSVIPMLPLGLKETKEINFREPFKDFVKEHYYEDPIIYEDAITEFMELREAMRTPERDESGVALLYEYFNQLYFIDRRFFPPDRSLGIYFEWFDSLTGMPSCQRTVAFEKACVLFNLGALHTQLGARHDRKSQAGLDAAVNCFLRSAGIFRFLHETFTNAPSKDLSPEVLDALIQLMLAQSRECLHEKAILQRKETPENLLELSQESAQVAKDYLQVFNLMSEPIVKDSVPSSWVSLMHIKSEHYKGRAHFYISEALLGFLPSVKEDELGFSQRAREILMFIHAPTNNNATIKVTLPTNRKERILLGLSHGREATTLHEEALRLLRMCRELRRTNSTDLSDVLNLALENALHLLDEFQDDDDLYTVLDPPPISPSTKIQLSLASPDFSQYKVEDIFKFLGPVSVFSARHLWTVPRTAKLVRTPTQGFGFAVKGDAPVVIAGVDRDSLAEQAGIHEGDILITISGHDVKWIPHEEVVTLIRKAGNTLNLGIVTLTDKTYYKISKSKSLKDLSPNSTTSSSSGVSSRSSNRSTGSSNYGSLTSSTMSSNKDKRLSWNPFKKTITKHKSESPIEYNAVR